MIDPADADLETLDRAALLSECMKLRAGIRAHRDSTGHDLCWWTPEIWDLLPERHELRPAVPPRAEFLERCAAYRDSIPEVPVLLAPVHAKVRAQGPARVRQLEALLEDALERLEIYVNSSQLWSALSNREWTDETDFIEDARAVLEGR